MSELSRRKLFTGLALAPFAGALAARGEETRTRSGAAVAPAQNSRPRLCWSRNHAQTLLSQRGTGHAPRQEE